MKTILRNKLLTMIFLTNLLKLLHHQIQINMIFSFILLLFLPSELIETRSFHSLNIYITDFKSNGYLYSFVIQAPSYTPSHQKQHLSNTTGFHLDGISLSIDVIIFKCACSFEGISFKTTRLLRI